MSFNNKRYKIAQAVNPQLMALNAARQMAVSDTEENVSQDLVEKGVKKGFEKLAPNFKQTTNLTGLKGMGVGLGASLGTSALLNLGEEMKGPKAIFNDYYSDYTKLLNALSALYPQNSELQNMVNLGKQIGSNAYKTMASSNLTIPTVSQAIGTGVQSGINQAKDIGQLGMMAIGRTPAQAVYNHRMTKIAIVGEANFGQYGRAALEGGIGGAVGGVAGAAMGAASSAGYEAAKDIWHNTRSNEYKAAAYTNQLIQKVSSLAAQLGKVDKNAAAALTKYATDLDNYVKKKIYKGGGTALEKGISAITNFLTGQKDEEADQSTIDQANELAKNPNALNSEVQQGAAQDPEVAQEVQRLMSVYEQGMQYYNSGDAQNYNAYKTQYTQGLQNLSQYISQKFPDQDPNTVLGQYVQQMQQMQQQNNMLQPQ